ncbi:hypothetical protein BKA93DRAFT_932377 [Sparassis latifolia]
MMESSDIDVDSSAGHDDNEAAASAVGDPVFDVPNITINYTVLDLSWLPRPIASSQPMILVRQEYVDAMATFEKDQRPVVLTGQPGIGKTLFLVYALIKRLIKGQPTILSINPFSYYLFRESGAYRFTSADMDGSTLRSAIRAIHNGVVPGGNFAEEDAGWVLYDSNDTQGSLVWNSVDFLPWKVVFCTLPKSSRYKEWAKQKKLKTYV